MIKRVIFLHVFFLPHPSLLSLPPLPPFPSIPPIPAAPHPFLRSLETLPALYPPFPPFRWHERYCLFSHPRANTEIFSMPFLLRELERAFHLLMSLQREFIITKDP